MPYLTLTLFGSLSIAPEGRSVVRLESDKVRGLPARLEPERALCRETLSALLWPDASAPRAAQNLRQALSLAAGYRRTVPEETRALEAQIRAGVALFIATSSLLSTISQAARLWDDHS